MFNSISIAAVILAAFSPTVFSDVIYDSLCITDDLSYANGTGNHCGGEDVWGEAYDLQLADGFTLTASTFITAVTIDSLTWNGTFPSKVCVGFFVNADQACLPASDPHWRGEITDGLEHERFDDPIFGFNGVRTFCTLPQPPLLEAGEWFASMQPASRDWGYTPTRIGNCDGSGYRCPIFARDGGERNACCDGRGGFGYDDWHCECFYGIKMSMRIEGIPAGDCVGGEGVSAKCKARGGGDFNVIVKVRDWQPDGTVTALLDPPDPRDIRIPLDAKGRGKGKFKRVSAGDHRVFVCDAVLDVTCAP